MQFIVLAFLLAPSAMASQQRLFVIAERYSSQPHEATESIRNLIHSESPTADVEEYVFPKRKPLDSLFNEMREAILSYRTDNELLVDILIESHGKTTSIASECSADLSYTKFAEGFLGLLANLKAKGFNADRLSFRMFADFCYSGQIVKTLPKRPPFNLVLVTSTSSATVSYEKVLSEAIDRATRFLTASTEASVPLCGRCSIAQTIGLLIKYFTRFDLHTGSSPTHGTADPPEVHFFGPKKIAEQDLLSEIAKQSLELYYFSLSRGRFSQQLESAYFDSDNIGLRKTYERIHNELSEKQQLALLLLRLETDIDSFSDKERDHLFEQLGRSPDWEIRNKVTEILRTYLDYLLPLGYHLTNRYWQEKSLGEEEMSPWIMSRIAHSLAEFKNDAPAIQGVCDDHLQYE